MTAFNNYLIEQDAGFTIDLSVYTKCSEMRLLHNTKINDEYGYRPYWKYNHVDSPDEMFLCSLTHDNEVLIDTTKFILKPKFSFSPKIEIQNNVEIQELMELVECEKDNRWNIVGIILQDISNTPEMLNIFINWSTGYGPDFNEKECRDKWGRFKVHKNQGIGFLINKAKVENPTGLDNWFEKWHSNPAKEHIRLLTNIPKKKRTRQQQADLDTAVFFNHKQAINELVSINEHCFERIDKYVDNSIFNDPNKVIIVKAGLGKGKSTSINRYLENIYAIPFTVKPKVLVLTPRIAYAKSVHFRLLETGVKFDIYQTVTDIDTNCVVQVESIHKCIPCFDLVIMDESESILSQMTSIDTHRENHTTNIENLKSIIKFAKKVIALDAFISNRTFGYFQYLNIPYSFYHFTVPNVTRKAVNLITNSKQHTWNTIRDRFFEMLDSGKKIYFMCSSAKKIKELKGFLECNMPHLKIAYYFSDHVPEIPIEQVNRWVEFDAIIVSTTITVGVNFDTVGHFDCLFLYGNNQNCGVPRDWFQSLYRTRHINENILYYAIDTFMQANYIQSPYDLQQDMLYKEKQKLKQYNVTFGEHMYNNPEYQFLNYFDKYEKLVSYHATRELVDYYLTECGYQPYIEPIRVPMKLDLIIPEWPIILDYDEIPVISPEQYSALCRKGKYNKLTENEKIQMIKYRFNLVIFNNEHVQEHWDYWTSYNKNLYYNVSLEKAFMTNFVTIDNLISNNDVEIATTRDITLRLPIIKSINQILRIRNSVHINHDIEPNQIIQLGQFYSKEWKNILKFWPIKIRKPKEFRADSILNITNQILSIWSFSELVINDSKSTKRNKIYNLINRDFDYSIENDFIFRDNDEIKRLKRLL